MDEFKIEIMVFEIDLDHNNRETWGRLNLEAFHDYQIHLIERA